MNTFACVGIVIQKMVLENNGYVCERVTRTLCRQFDFFNVAGIKLMIQFIDDCRILVCLRQKIRTKTGHQ